MGNIDGIGDLTHFKKSKIPTLPSHKNVCQHKQCIQWTFPLSYFDKQIGRDKLGFPIYERTTKWKCENGHRIDTTSRVDSQKRKIK